jgi:serine O-acetyltransferase
MRRIMSLPAPSSDTQQSAHAWAAEHLQSILSSPLSDTDWPLLASKALEFLSPQKQEEIINWYRYTVETIQARDPAAHGLKQHSLIFFASTQVAIFHKLSRELWPINKDMALLLMDVGKVLTGAEIPPTARIGNGVIFDHGMTTVGATAIIGDSCVILPSALGNRGSTLPNERRHPLLEDYVTVGINSTVLGRIEIGMFAVIGAGSLVTESAPPFSVVVGQNEVLGFRDPFDRGGRTLKVNELIPDAPEQKRYSLKTDRNLLNQAAKTLDQQLTAEHIQKYGPVGHYRDTLPITWPTRTIAFSHQLQQFKAEKNSANTDLFLALQKQASESCR